MATAAEIEAEVRAEMAAGLPGMRDGEEEVINPGDDEFEERVASAVEARLRRQSVIEERDEAAAEAEALKPILEKLDANISPTAAELRTALKPLVRQIVRQRLRS